MLKKKDSDSTVKEVMEKYAEKKGQILRDKYYDGADSNDDIIGFDSGLAYSKIKPGKVNGLLPLSACAAVLVLVIAGAFGGFKAEEKSYGLQAISHIFEEFNKDRNKTELKASSIEYDYSRFPSNKRVYLPYKLPEGFSVNDYYLENEVFTIEYVFGSKNLTYSQGQLMFDSETELGYMERIDIDGGEGYIYRGENGYNQLIWFRENTTFVLIGNIDDDSLRAVAESVK